MRSSNFFHAMANGRHNRDFIPHVLVRGQALVGLDEIGLIFTDHFRSHLGTKWNFSPLEISFSLDEIKKAMFELVADKANPIVLLYFSSKNIALLWNRTLPPYVRVFIMDQSILRESTGLASC